MTGICLLRIKSIEIEIKLPVENPEEVKRFLDKKGKLVSKDIFQKDTYYIPVHRDFLNQKYPFEWLRIRETSHESSITYKHFFPENVKQTDYCDEFETKIENPDAMRKILQSVDMKEVCVVEKVRTTWMFESVEIVLDEVKDLESHVELETTTHYDNPKDGKDFLYKVLEQLHVKVGTEDLRGYPYRILEKKGYSFGG